MEKIYKSSFDIEKLFDRLWPIPRSLTGAGFRESLKILSEIIPFEIMQIPSKTKIFDWETPLEWIIDEAYLIDPEGRRILDFDKDNLCIVNYSTPIDTELSLDELQEHLHSIIEFPEWVPYVTSYYEPNWGFCISHNERLLLKPGKYKAVINSSLVNGHIQYGRYVLKGTEGRPEERQSILISSYLCHPSMANNELSGPILLCMLYERICNWKSRRFDYIFVINPETIGSICHLYQFRDELMSRMNAGIVLTCLGGWANKISYQKSRRGNSNLDLLFEILKNEDICEIREFDPTDGSDERQYCAGEFNLPVGQISKTIYGSYPEYHTSADNKDFVNLNSFLTTAIEIENVLKIHEHIYPLRRLEPFCELQLGKRGLYPQMNIQGRNGENDTFFKAIMYILSYADGEHNIIDIAKKSNIPIEIIVDALSTLNKKGLLH